MLLRDPNIEVAFGKALTKFLKARSLCHRCGDAHNIFIVFSERDKRISEHILIGWRIIWILFDFARFIIVCPRSMPLRRVTFGNFPTFAFFGDNLHHDRAFYLLHVLEDIQHLFHIVTIKRSEEFEAKFLKNGTCLAM